MQAGPDFGPDCTLGIAEAYPAGVEKVFSASSLFLWHFPIPAGYGEQNTSLTFRVTVEVMSRLTVGNPVGGLGAPSTP